MLNRMVFVTAAGEGTANDRLWHLTGKERSLLLRYLLFLCLNLGDILKLFLYSGKQLELRGGKYCSCWGGLCRRRFRRRRNGGLSARRLFLVLWIYL